MPTNRKKPPFWRRKKPSKKYDIARLRPSSLPRGRRFETEEDAIKESERAEVLFRTHAGHSKKLANKLRDCREGDITCDKPQCPICARKYRQWLTGQLLRLANNTNKPIDFLTVLLEQAPAAEIDSLSPKSWDATLRKRLAKAGLSKVSVIAGYEMYYKAPIKSWILHANLIITDGPPQALDAFKATFKSSDFQTPVRRGPLQNAPEQLSYVSKFTTYHRPLQQSSNTKAPAVPLNSMQHHDLMTWMSKLQFKDFLFLYNARRHGPRISLTRHRK